MPKRHPGPKSIGAAPDNADGPQSGGMEHIERTEIRVNRLSALEKNELKRRALEMILLLFYIEDLKHFVVSSIRATDHHHDDPSRHRLPGGTKNLYKKAWTVLVEARVLTKDEGDEIEELIDYRNLVAHQTQRLTSDISRYPSARVESAKTQYEFDALNGCATFERRCLPACGSALSLSSRFGAFCLKPPSAHTSKN